MTAAFARARFSQTTAPVEIVDVEVRSAARRSGSARTAPLPSTTTTVGESVTPIALGKRACVVARPSKSTSGSARSISTCRNSARSFQLLTRQRHQVLAQRPLAVRALRRDRRTAGSACGRALLATAVDTQIGRASGSCGAALDRRRDRVPRGVRQRLLRTGAARERASADARIDSAARRGVLSTPRSRCPVDPR